MTEPKIVFKYTHAQAVADGELRSLEWPVQAQVTLYISKDASKLFEKEDDETIKQAAAFALLMTRPGNKPGTRIKCQHSGINYELVLDFESRDDDKRQPCATIVVPGER